jgi:hypothetical protein
MNLQQVHLRINDAATGQPTPVRLRITDDDGTYYAPYGRLTEFATGVNRDVGGNVVIGAKKWAYIDGTCEILLPPGKLHIEIAKGPEYTPIDGEVTLLAGKMALRFTIERWSDVRKQGWYSGDTRVHFLSPDAALLEGQAEDVAVVNLLARETTIHDQFGQLQPAIPNIVSFSGQAYARLAGSCGVAVNTQNVHPQLGRLGLLHCHRVVYPLAFNFIDWTLADWCDQCHRKKGLVVWTDPLHETGHFRYGEPLADLILGKIDAFEVTFFEDSPFDVMADYYQLLQAGLVVPLVGASGKESNGVALGLMRTYAYVPADQEFTYSGWIDAVRAGRCFVSNGPMLEFTLDFLVPQSRHEILAGEIIVEIRAVAKSLAPFEKLELLWNGKVIASASPAPAVPFQSRIFLEFVPQGSGWLAVRCVGEALLPSRPAPQRVFAHSSAVAVHKHGSPDWADAAAVKRLLSEVEAMLRWTNETAECNAPGQRERLNRVFEQARTVLAKKLS